MSRAAWRPRTRGEFGPYVRCVADKLELRDWTTCVSSDPPSNPNWIASASCPYGLKTVTISLSERFLSESETEQRATICHELIHAHWWPVDHLLRGFLTEGQFDAYRLGMEYAVEALAQTVAPRMPLPSEVRPTKAGKR